VGPLSAIIMVAESHTVASTPEIPFWALCYGSAGFVLGIVTMGRLTIKTVGTKLTTLTPSKSFATQMGGAVAVLGSSALGLPVSTSHCLVGSVVGIGVFEQVMKTGHLNLAMLSRIALAWGMTIPLAMIVSTICFVPFMGYFE
jgi:PiT family inorganic phosphate transporter